MGNGTHYVTVKNEKNKVLETQNKKLLGEIHIITTELANIKTQLQNSESDREKLIDKLESSANSVNSQKVTEL